MVEGKWSPFRQSSSGTGRPASLRLIAGRVNHLALDNAPPSSSEEGKKNRIPEAQAQDALPLCVRGIAARRIFGRSDAKESYSQWKIRRDDAQRSCAISS